MRRDEASGAEMEGDAKLTLPNGETILLPYLKVDFFGLRSHPANT